jgi:predicted dehydrogenase
MVPYQRLQLLGSKGRIEIEIPYNAPPDRPTNIYLDNGSQLGDISAKKESFPVCDQYKLQAEKFVRIVRKIEQAEFDLKDSRAQMRVIDALFRSAQTGTWSTI